MEVQKYYEVENPSINIPWEISPDALMELFQGKLHKVVDGYYCGVCVSLCGLSHQIGFHFHKVNTNQICEIEIFGNGQRKDKMSYDLFQKHLEKKFGPPHETEILKDITYPKYKWIYGDTRIIHRMDYRFMSEEKVLIRKNYIHSNDYV